MLNLTIRDQIIMRDLALNAPLQTEEQLVTAEWHRTPAGRKNGQRRLGLLCRHGVLDRRLVHVKPIHRVALIGEGGPNKPSPRFEELARESRARAQLPIRPVIVYRASRRTRIALGAPTEGGAGPLHALSHTLGVSGIYLHLKRTVPELAALWVSEQEFLPGGFREAQPDAFLCDAEGRKLAAMEFALDYPAERFRRLHESMCEQGLNYLVYGAAP